MTDECNGLSSPSGKPTRGAVADGTSPPNTEFMTQAVRRMSKRAAMSPGAASPTNDDEGAGDPVNKRLRLDEDAGAAGQGDEGPTTTHFDPPRASMEESVACTTAAAAGGDGRAPSSSAPAAAAPAEAGKGGKSILQTVFSPLFSVFQRGHGGEAGGGAEAAVAAAPAAGSALQGAGAPELAPKQGVPEPSDAGEQAGGSAAGAHAHHPRPPEVPEAAESDLDEDEDDFVDFDPLLFIKTLPPLEQCIPKHRPVLLPRKTRQCKRMTLVLDLDETLVHSSLEQTPASDFSFEVHFNNSEHVIHVRQRPHLHEFMRSVADAFEVVVFTASQRVYAEKLLNVIDPKRTLIKHRIYRESCVFYEGNYLKDLTVLGRDLATTFIVDNSPQAFGFQPNNGIPIESWYDDEADSELLKLLPFLHSLADVDDVRPHIASKFRLTELLDKIPLL